MESISSKKQALVRMMQILIEETDLNNPMTQEQIRDRLNDRFGIVIRRQTVADHLALLQNAARNGFIEDDDDVLERFELHRLNARFGKGVQFSEKMIEPRTKDMLYRDVQRYLSNETLLPELDRIYAGKSVSMATGHPVHYLLRTDSAATRRGLCELLTEALYANKRLRSRRYCAIGLKPDGDLYPLAFDALYKSCIGGALVVQFAGKEDPEDECRKGIPAACGMDRRQEPLRTDRHAQRPL